METNNQNQYSEHSSRRPWLNRFGKIGSGLLTILGYAIIIIVFITPFLYVIGNSVRNSQQIWQNAYPISWKSFVPFEGVTLDNFKLSNPPKLSNDVSD